MGKLLIVDDDAALRRLMRLELRDTYEIIDSGEPEQGLALALEAKPEAILLDLRMPKYSGYELLQTFTSFSHTEKIPVIIVSGEAGGQTKEPCKQLGAAGYFEKPIAFDALRICLRQIAKNRVDTPRSEVRVRLRVPLKLRGSNDRGEQCEELATTENVSMSDGSGYPRGLKGEQILLGARIFAMADTLDAITSERPYQHAASFEFARQRIRQLSGTQFDPQVATVFLNIPEDTGPKIKRNQHQIAGLSPELRRSSDLLRLGLT